MTENDDTSTERIGTRFEVGIEGDDQTPTAPDADVVDVPERPDATYRLTVSGDATWLDVYTDDADPGEDHPIWSDTPEEVTFEVPHDVLERYFQPEDTATMEVDGPRQRPIPFWQIRSAVKDAPDDAEYAVVRSDGDRVYADSLAEARRERRDLQASIDHLAPGNGHTVQMIDLAEHPPEA